MSIVQHSPDAWLLLLVHDSSSFARTRREMRPLVDAVVAKIGYDADVATRQRMRRACMEIIPRAADMYLQRLFEIRGRRLYAFSTYATWWLAEAARRILPPGR